VRAGNVAEASVEVDHGGGAFLGEAFLEDLEDGHTGRTVRVAVDSWQSERSDCTWMDWPCNSHSAPRVAAAYRDADQDLS
jgi:hypothetical protein